MTISVPLKDDVTATLRAETSACTDSLAPGCCSRLISSTLLSGVSLATGGGAGGFLRCASPGLAQTIRLATRAAASAAFAFLPAWTEITQLSRSGAQATLENQRPPIIPHAVAVGAPSGDRS